MVNNFGYDYSYAEPAVGTTASFVLVFALVFYLLVLAFSVTAYILQSLGMYTIAKRRGIHHPWLSWLPIGNVWLLGSISDQYQYIAKGRVRNRRKVLLGLSIGMYASVIPMLVSLFAAAFSEAAGSAVGDALLGTTVVVVLFTYLVMIVLAIILLVFEYMALYDLFASCDPGNAVLFLVLTICLGVVLPFFVFACRNKDLGMPPRKPVRQTQSAYQPSQPLVGSQPAAEETVEETAEETEG